MGYCEILIDKVSSYKSQVIPLGPNVIRGLDSRTGLADWTRGLDWKSRILHKNHLLWLSACLALLVGVGSTPHVQYLLILQG